jgi:hypothetical protein
MSNPGVKYTRAFFVIMLLLIAVYDVLALTIWGVEATISRTIGIGASFDAPTIPFGIGIVMGHLFWPQPRTNKRT